MTSLWQGRLVRPCVALGTSGQCVGSTPRDALADKLPVPPVRSPRDADTTAADLCVYRVRIPGHPMDFDGDGVVGITDLLELLANWGPCV